MTDRRRECDALGRMIKAVRAGQSRALVLRGDPEIGARLFVSARTVEWHLHKVFAKLAIGSRRELQAALAQRG